MDSDSWSTPDPSRPVARRRSPSTSTGPRRSITSRIVRRFLLLIVDDDACRTSYGRKLPAWLFAAERYVGIDRRGPAGRQVAGKERGTDQRNRRHHQHPRIDDGDVQIEIRARDRPADEANPQPEDEPVEHRTIAV